MNSEKVGLYFYQKSIFTILWYTIEIFYGNIEYIKFYVSKIEITNYIFFTHLHIEYQINICSTVFYTTFQRNEKTEKIGFF